LSGIASDGTIGLQEIKSQGGFTFAQDPQNAQFDQMPRNAILSGVVDVIETPEGIAAEIVKIAHLFPLPPVSAADADKVKTGPEADLHRIFAMLQHAGGVDFTPYKQNTIQRRIARRMHLVKAADLHAYAQYLAEHPQEVKQLFEGVLIQVT